MNTDPKHWLDPHRNSAVPVVSYGFGSETNVTEPEQQCFWRRVAVFRILIGFNADPDLASSIQVHADPDVDPDPEPGFWWPKIYVKIIWWKNNIFFIKNVNLLILGPHKGRQSYRRSLALKSEYPTWVTFCLLDPDPHSQWGSGSCPQKSMRIQILLFSSVTFKMSTKIKFFDRYFLKVHLHHSSSKFATLVQTTVRQIVIQVSLR